MSIFDHVPVINWTGLLHASARAGLVTMGDGWIGPAQVKLVHDAVLAACDAQDGVADGLVEDAVGCKAHVDPAKLLCASGTSGDHCLSEAQVTAIHTQQSPYKFSFALANGITEYPGWGVSGEGTPAFGPIAARSGIGGRELARQALAWRHGGLAGLQLLHREWDPVAEDPESGDLLKAARTVLRSKTGAAESVEGNRVTSGRLQLRLGRDLRWYPYARSDGDWEPSGPPEADPARAVAAL